MVFAGMGAGDKGVQPLDPMGKAVLHQKIKRAIGGWRLGAPVQHFEDLVGPKGTVFLKQDFQHPFARRGQLQSGVPAMGICSCDTRRDAMFVVMGFESDHSGLICYNITSIKRHLGRKNPMPRLIAVILLLIATPLRADVPRVVTDIAPVHSLVAMVMGDLGAPDLLLPASASPHHYSLRPSEAAALERADLVIWIGHGLTPWLEKPVAQLAGEAESLELLDSAPVLIPLDDHDHDDDHGHEGAHDPHAWLDPVNAVAWVGQVAEALAAADPAHAATYRQNAATATARISALQDQIAEAVKPLQKKRFAVHHDAYGYFEARFEVNHSFAISDSHATDPGPARIAKLRDSIRINPLDCIFTQGKENVGPLETVIEGHHAKVVETDPIGAELTPGPLLYLDLMHRLSESMSLC